MGKRRFQTKDQYVQSHACEEQRPGNTKRNSMASVQSAKNTLRKEKFGARPARWGFGVLAEDLGLFLRTLRSH